MFDQLFQHPHALARHRDGPLSEERRRYLAHCAAQQLAVLTLRQIANYTLAVAKVLRLADRPGESITAEEIEAEAKRWARHRSKPPKGQVLEHARRRFQRHALRWLQFLGRLQPPATAPRPYTEQIAQFTDYQLRERGLSPNTVERHSRALHRFLSQLEQAGRQLQTLSITQVDELLATKIGEEKWARRYISTWVSTVRPFLRFAEGRGWCRPGLADAMMAPRIFRHESLPVGPSWEDVKRLLAAAEGGRPVDIRDRAVLMMLAVYGLRAGEVAALSLSDFDWEQEVLTVRYGKSRRPRVYPLCRPVGDAVLRYLREVRPRSDRREVFLTVRAPFRPLAFALGAMVQRRLRALGLTLPRYGPHALRHACATHLLSQGLSLKEIGDHLGHRSPEATSIYAKVDLSALRAVADFSLEGLL
jgi:site-specific recombinase XerD